MVLGLGGRLGQGIESTEMVGAVTQPDPAAEQERNVPGVRQTSSIAAPSVSSYLRLCLQSACSHLLWEMHLLHRTVFPSHSVEINNTVIPD